jgi:hypothetical protein
MDFTRRVRAVHVTIEYARDLLNGHRSEYVVPQSDVSDGYKANQTLQNTIEKSSMQWAKDFIDGGANYHDKYALNLIKAKVNMRSEIYGRFPFSVRIPGASITSLRCRRYCPSASAVGQVIARKSAKPHLR